MLATSVKPDQTAHARSLISVDADRICHKFAFNLERRYNNMIIFRKVDIKGM